MNAPVHFGLAISNSFPSGTGSFNYIGSFQIVVQNLAFQKQVSIWAQMGSTWQDIAASYVQSLPDNLELWSAPASNGEGEFVAKYTVNSMTFWDNNGGSNYKFPQAFDEFVVLAGAEFKVVLGTAGIGVGMLDMHIGVQNLAFFKQVGIVFSTDDWVTVHTASAGYSSTMKSGLEVWHLVAPVGAASEVEFAIFYRVLGTEFWDNNFWRNYRVTPGTTKTWGDPP